ncbi:MAG: hypothetical protein KME21_10505 [Desmonostoc vinosum HA7617-LM4]|jgi:hypothetical protein|nr:hypothetical protein [Desmonostoc vinosum HA7617-LM4]
MTTNIHFNARVNNGTIEIPIEYQDEIRSAEIVQIVILKTSPKKKHFLQTGIIAQLTANPIQIAGFKPFPREE